LLSGQRDDEAKAATGPAKETGKVPSAIRNVPFKDIHGKCQN
jgi:hypothetical protein